MNRITIRFSSASDIKEGLGSRGPKPRGWQERFRELYKAGSKTECWNWLGEIGNNGYGRLEIANVSYLAHRLSYVLANGTIDPDLVVMHSCDNRRCVNPFHLSLGTHADNVKDAFIKGRLQKGERNGLAKLSEKQVMAIKRSWSSGSASMTRLATQYGVLVPCISRIVNGTRWRHLA